METVPPLTYPCLIDSDQVLSELYNIVNVRQAVWINEDGRIVRPPEIEGTTMMIGAANRGDEQAVRELARTREVYRNALRDWVEHGDRSEFALSPQQVIERMRPPDEDDALAGANFRIGQRLMLDGHAEEGERFLREAMRLRPQKWNYIRQGLNLIEPGAGSGPEFREMLEQQAEPLYMPAEIDGIATG